MAPYDAERFDKVVSLLQQRNANKNTTKVSLEDGAILGNLLGIAALGKDPLKGSKNALDAKVAAILSSNAPDSTKKAVLGLSSSAPKGKSNFQKTLDLLGKGKSAVVATVGRIADPNRNWLKDFQGNVGVSDLLANQDWYKKLDPANKLIIGLGGDIALDPLTYLAGAGFATKIGSGTGAAKLAFDAADVATAAGKVDEAARLSSIGQKAAKGYGLLSSGERSAIRDLAASAGKASAGEKTGGLFLNVPGTGRIARPLTGLELKQVQILPESVASFIPSKLRGAEEFVRGSAFGQKVKPFIGGEEQRANLIGQLRRGTPEQARAAYHTINGDLLGSARKAAYLNDMETARLELVNTAKQAKVDMEDITKALGGDDIARTRVDSAVVASGGPAGFMDAVRSFDDAVVDEAHRLVGAEFINKIENHAPTKAGPGVSGGTPIQGRNNPFDPIGLEKRATKPGDSFLGEILLDPKEISYGEVIGRGDEGQIITRSVPKAEAEAAKAEGRLILDFGPDELGRDIKSQREAIAKAKFGEDYQAMYNMNWDEASAAQVRGVANRVRGEIIKNHLRSKGIAKDIYTEVLSNAAQNAREVLPGLRAELEALDANNGILRVLRDVNAKDLKSAQENLEWVAKESADNVASARQVSEAMSEMYSTMHESVQGLFDEAAAAGVKLENAVLDRKMAEEVLTVLGPDSPMVTSVTEELAKISDDLAKETAKTTGRVTDLERAIEKYSALYSSLDDSLKANWKMAERIDELVAQRLEITRKLNELQGISPEVPPLRGSQLPSGETVEGVVRRQYDPLNPTGRALRESQIVNDAQKAERSVGRLVNTREANVVAEYDNLAAAVDDFANGVGTSSAVRSVTRRLNAALREANIPAVAVRGTPEEILASAEDVLRRAELLKRPDVVRNLKPAAGREVRKLNRALKAITKELNDIEPMNPRETLAKLMEERNLMSDTVEDLGVNLEKASTRAEDARAAENANNARLQQLRDERIAASQSNRDAQVRQKLDTEIAMREEASRLRSEALAADDRIRATLEEVQAADNAALEAELIAAVEMDKAQAAVARLEALNLQNEADLARNTRRAERLENKIGRLATDENKTNFIRVIEDGFARLDMTTQAPDHIVEALTQVAKMTDPKEMGLALKTFDLLTNMFKSWAILTPGFHVRNFIGGMFNNYLAGVNVSSYKDFLRADKIFMETFAKTGDREAALQAIGNVLGKSRMDAYRVVESSAVLKSSGLIGSTSGELGVGTLGTAGGRGFGRVMRTIKAKGSGKVIVDNPLTRVNYLASERVERTLRGSLAFDVALKGGDEFEAIGAVYKFHFNYDDLSSIERRYMKRISPFYTWSRRNVPLQVEMLFQKPVVYARIGYIQDNIEKLSPADDLVPSWFSEVGGFRLPFTNPSGERLYMMPDLPPLDLRKVTNPQEWLGEINPVIKVPLELQFNKQLYNQQNFREGYVPFPEAWNKLGIGLLTDRIGMTKIDSEGQRVGRDSQIYALESYMPLLGRLRRMFPSEDKYQRRAVATWASMVLGLGFRANTEADKKGELYRRGKAVEKINTDLEGLKYGGYKTLSRDVATKFAPTKDDKSPYLIVSEPKFGLPVGSPYTMPTQGRTGGQSLDIALRQLQSRGASQDLLDLARRVSEGRKK